MKNCQLKHGRHSVYEVAGYLIPCRTLDIFSLTDSIIREE